MTNQVKMTCQQVDFALARNLMKWHRLTRDTAKSDSWIVKDSEETSQILDPHWFDKGGEPVAIAEAFGSHIGAEKIWSPTRNPADSQRVRTRLAEKFQSIILGRLGKGALFAFFLIVDRQIENVHMTPFVAMGISEEIATSLCALETIGIHADIQI